MKILIAHTDSLVENTTVKLKSLDRISVSWGDLQDSSVIGSGPLTLEKNCIYLHYSGKSFSGYPAIVAEYDDETNELDIQFVSISNNKNQDNRIKKVIYVNAV